MTTKTEMTIELVKHEARYADKQATDMLKAAKAQFERAAREMAQYIERYEGALPSERPRIIGDAIHQLTVNQPLNNIRVDLLTKSVAALELAELANRLTAE